MFYYRVCVTYSVRPDRGPSGPAGAPVPARRPGPRLAAPRPAL